MIGDRLLTDIVFANQNQMLSILISPLTHIYDHPISIVIRFLEMNILLPIIRFLNHYKLIKN